MSWWTATGPAASSWPIVLCLLSYVVTFLVTRTITRLIRAGKGPFKNNVSSSGGHIHHAVPGLILLLIGALISVTSGVLAFRCFAAVLIGAGASLVLDEFALILHLQDVYWSREGLVSVQAVGLMGVVLGLVALGFDPITGIDLTDPYTRWYAIGFLAILAIAVIICVRKGKTRLLIVGIFIPVVAFVGAFRLARPGSPHFKTYCDGSRKQTRAIERARKQDRRWGPRMLWLSDLIAGAPTTTIPTHSTPGH